MSSATKDLETDHVHILRLTDVMEKITKADTPDILFRMADKVLTEEDHTGLLKEYSEVVPLIKNGGGLPEFLAEIERLDKKYQ